MCSVERVNGVDPGAGSQTPLFDRPSNWDREIKRTGAAEWRVCSINEGYVLSPRLGLASPWSGGGGVGGKGGKGGGAAGA